MTTQQFKIILAQNPQIQLFILLAFIEYAELESLESSKKSQIHLRCWTIDRVWHRQFNLVVRSSFRILDWYCLLGLAYFPGY
ncbi:MAG: hypothetical protein ICV86_18635 [Microcoleus sp. T3-bin5]|nr:hypothetical protein [Microcoleus sp. T3-bin5]